jgi:hypothetical protein
LVAAVFGGAALVAFLCAPGTVPHVGALTMTQPLAGSGPLAPPAVPDTADPFSLSSTSLSSTPSTAAAAATPPAAAQAVTQAVTPTSAPDPAVPTTADRAAGIRARTVDASGGGELDVVPGSAAAPGRGEVRAVRVEVERGLPVDGARFAGFVLATLNDDRSWGHDGAMTFARTDGDAPIVVVLASPETSSELCGDLRTRGMLSCRNGPRAVLTFHRWVNATDEYADNVTGYRQYVVNHEVGHALGYGHERCPGPGKPAPVMQQQTLGLKGCTQNSWPHPAQ